MTRRPPSDVIRLAMALVACGAAAVPAAAKQPQSYAGPMITASAAVVVECESGRLLFARNADLKRPPASTTKIMTGLLLAETCRPDETVTAPADTQSVKESSMHLMPGEQIRAEELLYALMLRSANDGCHAVAVHVAGSDEAFAKLMNERAAKIGCRDTTFVNPHGLHDPRHLTTAYDLALMAREAMKNELFAKVVRTQRKTVVRSLNLKDTVMVSRNKWLPLDPTALGVKTGYTKPAGHCFVGCAERNGMKVVTVILDSKDWVKDQEELTEWSYQNWELRDAVEAGTAFDAPVKDGTSESVHGRVDKGLTLPLPTQGGVDVDVQFVPTPGLQAPVRVGDEIGAVLVTYERQRPVRIPVLADQTVGQRPALAGIVTNPAVIGGFVALGGAALAMRLRSRRMAESFVRS
ncbi:MAG: D-alanyl-D-alanine carboxypeptidase [Armatimonadetes bacterium]|nr:D-alanyl-D-alanine carboxypeptidase [Armatimonadota bacterium]